jgi:hypothetical protein
MRRAALVACVLLAAGSAAADVPKAIAVLEVDAPTIAGHVGASAPVRFVLLETGQIYVGGTSEIAVGQLTSSEQKALEKRLGDLRKLPGIGGTVAFGSGKQRAHLVARKGRPLDMVVTGAFTDAPAPLRPLAALLAELASFSHPSLKRWQPASYALRAREGKLPGGCRPWPFTEPLTGTEFTPRVLPADQVLYWPTGAAPASVCAGDKSWIVTLRPLVPDETP